MASITIRETTITDWICHVVQVSDDQSRHGISVTALHTGLAAGEALARFIVDIVDQLDLSELEKRYGGCWKQPYHPAMLLGLLLYGYAAGVFSSRKLEQAAYDSVAFRFITGDAHSEHDTIASFRKRSLPKPEGLFVQVLALAKVMGVIKLGLSVLWPASRDQWLADFYDIFVCPFKPTVLP